MKFYDVHLDKRKEVYSCCSSRVATTLFYCDGIKTNILCRENPWNLLINMRIFDIVLKRDIAHLLRPAHLQQLSNILKVIHPLINSILYLSLTEDCLGSRVY